MYATVHHAHTIPNVITNSVVQTEVLDEFFIAADLQIMIKDLWMYRLFNFIGTNNMVLAVWVELVCTHNHKFLTRSRRDYGRRGK